MYFSDLVPPDSRIRNKENIMRIEQFNNYDELSAFVAELIASQIRLKPDSILGLATGSTPIGAYERLVEMHKAGTLDFSKCLSFNLDEYYPISKDNDQSYAYFMNENLFKHVNIKPENTHIPNGEAKDAAAECAAYDELLAAHGGVDLQLLGLGENGHIGFNEPDNVLDPKTHLTSLTQSTIEANSRFFASIDEVPKAALTMGVGTILTAKKIVIAISGEKKMAALERILSGKIDTMCPATLLNLHPDVVVAYCK